MQKKLLLTTLLTTSMAMGLGGTANAANERASCVGIAISEHAPAGEMPEQVTETKAFAEEAGTSFGTLVSGFARQHLGSHAACEGVG